MGEKRRFLDASDAGGEETGQRLRAEGGGAEDKKLEKKRQKEAKHNQGSFEGKGKVEAVEKRKRPLSEEVHETQKQKHEEAEGGSRASGEAAKKKRTKNPHNCPKSQFWSCEGSGTCEHRRILQEMQ